MKELDEESALKVGIHPVELKVVQPLHPRHLKADMMKTEMKAHKSRLEADMCKAPCELWVWRLNNLSHQNIRIAKTHSTPFAKAK